MTDNTTIYEITEGSDAILSFKGEYGFLSNFKRAAIVADGVEYTTLEHAYQALKTLDPEKREVIRLKANPHWARQASRAKSFIVREGWETMRVGVMRALLEQKFTRHHRLAAQLLETGDRVIAEATTWGDDLWGVVQGEDGVWRGQNLLGVLLMEVRDGLASGKLLPSDDYGTEAESYGTEAKS